MARVDDFDAFYHATRRGLLHQTYALTADLDRSASAVQHAYAHAWSEWRKIRRLPDPTAWVRAEAWRMAGNRRPRWRRRQWSQRRLADGRRRSGHPRDLEALQALPDGQRRAVVLHHLAELPVDRIAREIGISESSAASLLIRGEQAWADGGTSLGAALSNLDEDAAGVRMSRAPYLRRSGQRRHRQQTLVGVVTAAALLVGGGLLIVNDPASVQRAAAEPLADASGAASGAAATGPGAPAAAAKPPAPPVDASGPFLLDEDALLTAEEMRGVTRPAGDWSVTSTTDGTTGDPLYAACQQEPFADPDGDQSLVRRYRSDLDGGAAAVQVIEESASEAQSAKAFATMEDWYARCQDDGVQLLSTLKVGELGDQARAFQLRDIGSGGTFATVGIARTGPITTAVVVTTDGPRPVPAQRVLRSAGVTVTRTCLRVSGGCSVTPTVRNVPPLPAEEHPGFLAAFDLPKVRAVSAPWVGTDPARGRDNPASTPCERAEFGRGQHPQTRVFVLPTAKQVPRRFGITETVGTFRSPAAARDFVRRANARAQDCPDRELSASQPRTRGLPDGASGWVWRFEFEVAESRSVTYRVALVRAGRSVALLSMSPARGYDVTQQQFADLALRASHRLAEAPEPRR